MKIETNEKLIRRNARIAQISMIGGLVILVGGMVIAFRTTEYFGLSLAALVVGFILSQVGIYYGNRYGKRPRPDELLNQALKGLDGKYILYHYLTPAAHLLVGPAGIWILMPKSQRGTITYGRGRWRQSGGGIMASYLKIFAQEGIGRPDLEIQGEVSSIEKFLKSRLDDENLPAINAALVFTHEKVNVQIADSDNPPAITLPLSKLKEHIRKFAKGKPISLDKAQQIQDAILGESS